MILSFARKLCKYINKVCDLQENFAKHKIVSCQCDVFSSKKRFFNETYGTGINLLGCYFDFSPIP